MIEASKFTMDKANDDLDWRSLRSKRQKRPKFKDYQEELLQEIPGALVRTNVAMHAIIDVTAASCENQSCGMGTTSGIRNQALIHYIARLANSNSDNDEFDFSFVESLLENGADINTADKYGQTMFHEVARSWNVDVARFLLSKGANINQQDKYGRAPLHVAAAVDYTEMIEFLLSNDADISITTFGELQTPIHFAAKNDACQALKLLINYGASIHCRDYQNRTPLQVAASMSRSKAARYLVELGAPAGVYDHNGEMTLSLLILKMPEVATIALDQFRSQDMINRKEYNFLNYVEGPRIYDKDPRENKARSPLEVAIQHEQYGIVMHPVMKRLINNKWEQFGRKGAQSDLIINVIFAFVWTILGITMPKTADQLYSPLKTTWWRLVFALMAICLTCLETFKQGSNLVYMNKAIRRWKTFRQKALKNDKRFCHPQWLDENNFLEKEIKIAEEERLFSRQDGWIFLDWIALALIVAGLGSHIAFLVIGSKDSRDVHVRIVAFLLIVFWVRLLKFTRPFKEPGPFVASIAPMLKDFVKWSILFSLLFIPYAAIFWMIFGQDSSETAKSPFDIPGLLFTVFTMAAFSNLTPIEDFESIDKNMARLLTSTFVAISTIITLNLLIAMLADTFTRMYENSLETATMQRAKTILYLEQTLSSNVWRKYCEHILGTCSPEVTCLNEDVLVGKRDKKRLKETLHRCVTEIHSLVTQRFAERVGSEKSDMDRLLEGFNVLNNNLMSTLEQPSKDKKRKAEEKNATVFNLNVVLEQSAGKAMCPFQQKSGLRKTKNITSVVPLCLATTKEKEGKVKMDGNKATQLYLRSLSISSDSSSHGPELEEGKQSIRGQLYNVLDMMKQAVKTGKLNVKFNGKALTEDSATNEETPEESHSGEETEASIVDEAMSPVSERDWSHYETQLSENQNGTEVLSPVLDIRENRFDVSVQSSHDWQRNNNRGEPGSPIGELGNARDLSQDAMSRVTLSQNKNSASSSEGATTCEDSSEILQNTASGETHKSNYNEVRELDTNEDTDSENHAMLEVMNNHHDHQFEADSQQTSNGVNTIHSGGLTSVTTQGSDTDTGSHRTSTDFNNNRSSEVIDTDYVSSSFASDLSDNYLNEHVITSPESGTSGTSVDCGASSSLEVLSRTPRVTWADDADNFSGTPFVNIREISTSPSHSENYGDETHTSNCSGCEAIHHSVV